MNNRGIWVIGLIFVVAVLFGLYGPIPSDPEAVNRMRAYEARMRCER